MSDEAAAEPDRQRYARAETVEDFARNLAAVRGRIAAAAERAGRASDVRLLPVSKTVPEDRLRLAVQAGCRQL
ncbi:MAG: YggS family pyridoxal phosphate-dependent enzyme, partial [Actinomycetes bacterium]